MMTETFMKTNNTCAFDKTNMNAGSWGMFLYTGIFVVFDQIFQIVFTLKFLSQDLEF